MAHALSDDIEKAAAVSRDTERLLLRALAAWAAVGLLLAAAFGALYAALSFIAFGLWLLFAMAGLVLAPLAIGHARYASTWAARFVLAVGVPTVFITLWVAAAALRGAGSAIARWLSAI